MTLLEQLQQRLVDGRPFGFCPWEDDDGTLWGSLLALESSRFQIQLIGTVGEREAVEWYEFEDVYSFDFGERYSERLHRLREFVPTLPYQTEFQNQPDYVERVLREALSSGSVARVKFHQEDSISTVRVLSIQDGLVTMRDYDDLMQPYGLLVHRLANVTGIRIGTAHEEADEFVERASRP